MYWPSFAPVSVLGVPSSTTLFMLWRSPLTMNPSVLLKARRNPVSLVATPGSVLSSDVKSRPFRLSSLICVSEIV